MRDVFLLSVAIVACYSLPRDAVAQTDPAPSGITSAATGLEEVVVTAQRRKENIQDVPIAITAFSGAEVEEKRIEDKYSLEENVPGLTVTRSSGTQPMMFLRGIGSANSIAGDEPAVATYVDGFYQGPAASAALTFNNIESLEVLKGPQGTLYGRNATGGLLSVTTPTPRGEFFAKGSVGYGSYDTAETNAYVTGPFSDTVRADLAIHYTNQGQGAALNLQTGNRVGVDDGLALRSKLLIDISASTTLTLGAEYTEINGSIGGALSILPGTVPLGELLGGKYTTVPRDFYAPIDPLFKTDVIGTTAKLEANLGATEFVSMTQYRFHKFITAAAVAGTSANNDLFVVQPGVGVAALPTFAVSGYAKMPAFVTQEFQLLSNVHGPLSWIVGAYGQYSRDGYEPSVVSINALTLAPLVTVDEFATTRAYATYAQGTYAVDDKLSLTAGGRFSYEEKHTEGIQYAGGTVLTDDKSAYFDAFTYRLSADYKAMPGLLLYALTSKGFKSGVFNSLTIDNSPAVKPETLYDYEIGFKSDPVEGIRVDGAGYYYDYKNIGYYAQSLSGFGVLTNAAAATLYGVELSVEARPVRELTVFGAVALEHTYYDSFNSAEVYVNAPVAGEQQIFANATDMPVVQAPNFTGDLGIRYEFNLPQDNGKLSLASTYYHNGGYSWDPIGHVKEAAYSTVDAALNWTLRGGRWNIRLWGKNLSDALYFNQVTESNRGIRVEYALPRTFGMSIGYQTE